MQIHGLSSSFKSGSLPEQRPIIHCRHRSLVGKWVIIQDKRQPNNQTKVISSVLKHKTIHVMEVGFMVHHVTEFSDDGAKIMINQVVAYNHYYIIE